MKQSDQEEPLITMNRPEPGMELHTPAAVPAAAPAQNEQAQSDTTDLLGIFSIIAAFAGFPPIGIVLGLIGMSKAKKEGYSKTLSVVGTVLNTIFTVIGIIIIALIVFAISQAVEAERRDDDAKVQVSSVASELNSFFEANDYYPKDISKLQTADFTLPSVIRSERFLYYTYDCFGQLCDTYELVYDLELSTDSQGFVQEYYTITSPARSLQPTAPNPIPSISL